VAVFDLTFNPSASSLVAATHGRGMFRLQLDILTLAVVPAARTDSAVVGDVDPRLDSAAVVLSGADAGMAGWTAAHGAGSWLTVSTPGGTGSGSVPWVRDPTGLAPGWYVDTITVSVPGAAGSPGLVIDSLVALAPDVSAGCAVQHLLGTACLDDAQSRFLDLVGNRDGTYNLGDLLAHLARSGAGTGMGGRP
jgi:hypothetical protein